MSSDKPVRLRRRGVEVVTILASFLFVVGCRDAPGEGGRTPTGAAGRSEHAPAGESLAPEIVVAEEELGSAEPVPRRVTAVPQDVPPEGTPEGQSSAEPVVLTDANFNRLTDEGVVLVDFWAPWCQWCRRLAPIIGKLANEYAGKAVVAKLNTDESPETPARYAVRGLPTVIVLREGRLVAKLEGFRPEEHLRRALDAALVAE